MTLPRCLFCGENILLNRYGDDALIRVQSELFGNEDQLRDAHQKCFVDHEIAQRRRKVMTDEDGRYHLLYQKPEDKVADEPRYKLRPRNDYVVIRCERVEEVRGVAMPEISSEGKKYVVESVGPEVDDLNPGDVVRCIGELGITFAPIPNFPDRIIIREENVVLVLEPVAAETAYEKVAEGHHDFRS